nr:(2Fe-2S)-binding protein [Actinocatenispora thailandica]
MFAAGARATRRTASGALRGPYCNMGVCFECLVTVDGVPAIRSCTLPVRAGIRVETNR